MASFRELNADVEHWDVFERLLIQTGVSGSDVSDVYLAAFAVQNDATFVTFDRGFARFPGLRWMEPGSNDGSGTP
jgi:predicted nucleic acid-binding protein